MPGQMPCIIPARGGSKGILKKNIKPICGKPLVQWTIDALMETRQVSEIFISTDSSEIKEMCEALGAQVIMRAEELSGDTVSSEAVLLHALDQIDPVDSDSFLFVQCTSPLTGAQNFDRLINLYKEAGADHAFTVCEAKPEFLWQLDSHSNASAVNHNPEVRMMRQEFALKFKETGAAYVINRALFQKEKTRFCGRGVGLRMPTHLSIDIDDMSDFALAEAMLNWVTGGDANSI